MNNILELLPDTVLYTKDFNQDFINKYHLTLSAYTAYQLAVIMNQIDNSDDTYHYLKCHTKTFDENMDFRNGVNDAFCEIVKAGVKKLAFSHATDDESVFALEFHSAYHCAKKYGISFYIEESLFETLLFKNSGCKVLIFYKDEMDIHDYIVLKKHVLENSNPSLEEKKDYARELGRLLSYSPSRIEEMIEANILI